MEEDEGLAISLHPLAPPIPIKVWNQMSPEEQDKISRKVEEHYEKIGEEQMRINRVTMLLEEEFKTLPLWKKMPCWIAKILDKITFGGPSFLHNIDDSMVRKYIGEPHSFGRITYCKRCGDAWIDRRF